MASTMEIPEVEAILNLSICMGALPLMSRVGICGNSCLSSWSRSGLHNMASRCAHKKILLQMTSGSIGTQNAQDATVVPAH